MANLMVYEFWYVILVLSRLGELCEVEDLDLLISEYPPTIGAMC